MATFREVLTPAIENSIDQVSLNHGSAARVLIVHADPSFCEFFVSLLSRAGFDCTAVSSAEAALPLLELRNLGAVIAALNLPAMTGLDLLAEVRRRCPHLAFLVTAAEDSCACLHASGSGADDYLVKPLHEDLVIASLNRALRKKTLEKEVAVYRLRLDEMVAERTRQIHAALEQLEGSFQDTLAALGAAIDLRDASAEGHSRRVCRYSLEIAKALGLSGAQLKTIFVGACLHDIGKLALPDGILLKHGAFTPEERRLMQQHVQTGHDLVKQIPFLAEAAELILAHHERCDGSGYPPGLHAGQIPIGARIFAVADTLDTITSERPHRRARSFDVGLRVIRANSGRLFDSQVVEAFFTIPKDTWLAIARNQRQISSLPAWLRGDATFRPLASLLSLPRH